MRDRVLSFVTLIFLCFILFASFDYGKKIGRDSIGYKVDSVQLRVDSLTNYTASFNVDTPDPQILTLVDTMEVPADVDSASIFKDYFTRKGYDLHHRDTNIFITIKPYLFNNSLDSLHLDYRILRPQSVTHVSPKKRFEVYGGMYAGRGNISPTINFSVKEKWMAGVSYNLVDPTILVGLQYRLY